MTPTDRLAVWIQDHGGGSYQAWTTPAGKPPTGWSLMVFRDGNVHVYATRTTHDECVRAVLEQLGVTDG